MKQIPFSRLLNKHKSCEFLICCPGKNILEYKDLINNLCASRQLIVFGMNKISEIFPLNYHMFTNNDKYKFYGNIVNSNSTLILGENIAKKTIKQHKPKQYVTVSYTSKPNKSVNYNSQKNLIEGYYRTSGTMAILMCYLMGAKNIFVVGMSGYTYKFDGQVHYYKAEIDRDVKSKKEWFKIYDKSSEKTLDQLKKYGVTFSIITPTIFKQHFDGSYLSL